MKRPIVFSVLALLLSTLASPALAATPSAGSLVRISSRPDVYYVGANGKRYVFPNEKTYRSWYADFSTVTTIADADMASLPIGGAVTIRPGTTLVKITTDPKTYAIAHGGVLRWVQTEVIATALFGANWNTQVLDVADEYFTTYSIGMPVAQVSDFAPSTESAASPTINDDKALVAQPAPTPAPTPSPTPSPSPTSTPPAQNGSVDVTISKSPLHAGDVVTLTGTAAHPSSITKIEIYFDSQLVKACNADSCSVEVQVPISGTKPSYDTTAVATALNATKLTKTINTLVNGGASGLVKLRIGRSMIVSGQAGEAIVDSDSGIAVIRTDIFIDNVSVRACASSILQCRWSDILTGKVGKTFDVYGDVTDNIGRHYLTEHKTITIGTSDSPAITVAVGKPLIYKGETVDVSVTASDDNGISTIQILKDDQVIKSCVGPSPCVIVTGPWPAAGTLNFSGRASDTLNTSSTSDVIQVTVQ